MIYVYLHMFRQVYLKHAPGLLSSVCGFKLVIFHFIKLYTLVKSRPQYNCDYIHYSFRV